MPVIVVGADTPLGGVIARRLLAPDREVRAFVTDEEVAARLKRDGFKVAVGDVSDDSHVSAACTNCFSVVLITQAATDGRQQAFAADPSMVLSGWAEAASKARVRRIIWVAESAHPSAAGVEEASVAVDGRSAEEVADEVAALDEAAVI